MKKAAFGLMLAGLAATLGSSLTRAAGVPLAPGSMRRIATVDARYQSYNVEMVEVTGGNFWKPYDAAALLAPKPSAPPPGTIPRQVGQDPNLFQFRPPIDLGNTRLRRLAKALGPAYMRTSGSWANQSYFHDSDDPAPAAPPSGFQGTLTRPQWRGVVEFANAVDARLMTSFAVGTGVRDASGAWTSDQARRLLAYTKSVGGEVVAAEFFNEPNLPSYGGAPRGYDAAAYARDFAAFRAFARTAALGMLLAGPGSVGEGGLLSGGAPTLSMLKSADILGAAPRPELDVFSYHFYGAVSMRCGPVGAPAQTSPEAALSEEWLSRTDRSYDFYAGLRDRFAPGKPIWITETADAACGGNPWATTFRDSFRYLDQLGRLARHGVAAVFHNTLAASEYGLLEHGSFAPRPNYWAALLWHRLMGMTVLDAGVSAPELHVYAQCLPRHPEGVTILAINTSASATETLDLPKPADRYTLTAATLDSPHVLLNGNTLDLQADDALPPLAAARAPAGTVSLAPASITFLAVPDAGNAACR